MKSEESLGPQQSLLLIEDVITRTKDHFRSNSFYFMLWGWLISTASFSFFVLHQFTSFKFYFLPFPILVAAGIVTTLVAFFRDRARQNVETYSDHFISRLWMVLGLGFITIVVLSLSQHVAPFLFTIVIAAIGTLVSGLIMKFKPLITGGLLFFAAALIGIWVPEDFKPLLLTVSILTGYLLPGYLLKKANI